MSAEKNVSTVFPSILYNCFQCIPQKEALSGRKYKSFPYRREKKNNFAPALQITMVVMSKIE